MKKEEKKYDFSELTIEEGLKRLSKITGEMEEEDCSLESSFALYEEGTALIKYVNSKIEEVEAKVSMITKDGSEVPFTEGQES
ncbi:MAG: exodeoxyribonuclease VII small subunit [Lachnospiraceae bacterium]|nr:exodeoxyribonuclease VII small subunit [Lachnospiraceae bacterium]